MEDEPDSSDLMYFKEKEEEDELKDEGNEEMKENGKERARLRGWSHLDVTTPIKARATMDTILNDMASSMKKKYDKYKGELHKVNPFFMIEVVIDPWFKLRNMRHIFEEIFVGDEDLYI
ncbi:hypothetical protein L3X38_027033 [Prunus dulcis]|uniref:hAT-like transposase RNase-H fold domain-containing protein n=1 Tax=Prunus dulcis TaxID=3755 RepID=A0AAD4YZ29_PRUDU|nr:hypothetical protein L3X38_027033 [Prunus dulcis]